MRRHKNADIVTQTKYSFPDHVSQSGLCSICILCGQCEVGYKSKTGQTVFPKPFGNQFGAEKQLPNIEDLQIMPEPFGRAVIFEDVNTEIELGGFLSKIPVSVAAMGSTKVANNLGEQLGEAAKAGIPMVIGENMLATHGEEGLKKRMDAYLRYYDGYGALIVQGNVHDQKLGIFEKGKAFGAHGIEIKLGQGAKQGLGGEITFEGDDIAEKYRKLGYKIVKNPDGTYQRHSNPGDILEEEMEKIIEKYSSLDLPIWFKVGMGKGIYRLIDFLEKMRKKGYQIKALTVDGFGGGTGMSPWLIMNETGIPSAAIFKRRLNVGYDILLAGGYISGIDVAKGLMLGAKGVAMGRAFLIAAKQGGIPNFVKALRTEIQMICAILRVDDVRKIVGRRENLIALSQEAAEMFGIPSDPQKVL